ncbi:SIR2 family NAD-dependent protein deacylase [Paracidobacterium acidisoli]|uniref:NAD-dependent protein deacylase n=1 Tax=Paracidobacterium acidisoli TaxID=2303751 RepID=A0A372IU62_9BACT|nr:NAD-dependent deacylase [Paracidobacterium acidisoli]MBT9329906.1 NAD-dependent deacylase [Paracidobacterium acidisoli]
MPENRTTGELISIHPTDRVFVLTGAGVSAESGIPTFRDNGGLWHGYRVEEVATPEAWEEDAERVWHFYSMRRRDAQAAQPNPAHRALAELEHAIGDRFFLCTQNVDNLHERAGSERLLHMHGELFRSRCEFHDPVQGSAGFSCAQPPFADETLYESAASFARCACGGRIRPHIVWFGEVPLEMDRITAEIDRCTVMLVVGTSGNVYPAANFVHWAARRNTAAPGSVRAYYIGPEAPLNAPAFTRVVLGKAGEVLPGIFRLTE